MGAKGEGSGAIVCKYSRHSYLNLSLISGLPRKGIFSLLNEYRRETDKGEQKGEGV